MRVLEHRRQTEDLLVEGPARCQVLDEQGEGGDAARPCGHGYSSGRWLRPDASDLRGWAGAPLPRRPCGAAGARLGGVRRAGAGAAAARGVPDPDGPAADAGGAPAAVRRPRAAPRGDRPGRGAGAARRARSRRRGAARPPDPRHERYDGPPEGRVLRPAGRGRRHRAGARGAGAVGLRRRRRQPGAESPAPLRPAEVRARHPARRRTCRRARAVRPGDRHRRDRRAPADHDVLRAGPPPAALRPLGPGRRPGPLVVPPRRARGRTVPAGGQGAAGRALPGRARRGSSTGPRRGSSPPAAARRSGHGRAPSAAPGPGAR